MGIIQTEGSYSYASAYLSREEGAYQYEDEKPHSSPHEASSNQRTDLPEASASTSTDLQRVSSREGFQGPNIPLLP